MFDIIENKLEDVSLSKYCSFGVGGNCKVLLFVTNNQVPEVIQECKQLNMKYIVLGLGCNMLVADSGFDGVVIKLIDKDIALQGNCIRASGGASLTSVVNFATKNSLTGLEWAAGLPSSVGGALCGNAGAYGGCIADVLTRCSAFHNGNVVDFGKDDCTFDYRTSIFAQGESVILSATFELKQSTRSLVEQRVINVLEKRNNPKGLSAGCIFKNTKEFTAGQLIDNAGLKGLREGGAYISDQHANIIINDGTATATDVYNLIQRIKFEVAKDCRVFLQEEIKLIGF